MASFISFQRSTCAVCWAAAAPAFEASVVEVGAPGTTGTALLASLLASLVESLLESLLAAAVPGALLASFVADALVGSVLAPVVFLAESVARGLASESGAMAVDCAGAVS